jgi:hypothetical protein
VGNSRQDDLKHVDSRIQKLDTEARLLQERYTTYHGEVQQSIKDLMTKAGVWEKVNKLETERLEAKKKAEDKLRKIVSDRADFEKFRNFLLGRENEEVDPDSILNTEPVSEDEEEAEAASSEAEDDDEGLPSPPDF